MLSTAKRLKLDSDFKNIDKNVLLEEQHVNVSLSNRT
jgi:hypothetical protein